jgi:hypothetical protein
LNAIVKYEHAIDEVKRKLYENELMDLEDIFRFFLDPGNKVHFGVDELKDWVENSGVDVENFNWIKKR